MTNLDSMSKSRGITLPTQVHIVKAMVFPVVTYNCESWTIQKADWWRIDAFELWCWRRFLRLPWRAKRSNQSILREINPEYHWKDWCWSWNTSILVMWSEHLTHWKKSLILGKTESRKRRGIRGWDGCIASSVQWTWTWANFKRCWGTEGLQMQSMGSQRVGHDWVTEQQQQCLGFEVASLEKIPFLGIKFWKQGNFLWWWSKQNRKIYGSAKQTKKQIKMLEDTQLLPQYQNEQVTVEADIGWMNRKCC